MISNLSDHKIVDAIDLDVPPQIAFLIAYVLPVFAFIGVTFNILILIFLPRNSVLLSQTTKTYYLIIALGDLSSILSFNICLVFLDESLSYLTNDEFSIDLTDSELGCKIIYNAWTNSESLANYTAIAMAIEQIIALYFPLKARVILNKKITFLLIISCVSPIWVILTIVNLRVVVIDTPGLGQDGQYCGYTIKDQWFLISTYTQVVLAWCLPEILHIIGATLICFKLFSLSAERKQLFQNFSTIQNDSSTKAREINATVIVLLVVFSRIIIYFPVAVMTVYYYIINLYNYIDYINWSADDQLLIDKVRYIVTLGGITRMFLELTSITHSINFCIYLYRVSSFRQALLSFCKCFNHNSQDDFAPKF